MATKSEWGFGVYHALIMVTSPQNNIGKLFRPLCYFCNVACLGAFRGSGSGSAGVTEFMFWSCFLLKGDLTR